MKVAVKVTAIPRVLRDGVAAGGIRVVVDRGVGRRHHGGIPTAGRQVVHIDVHTDIEIQAGITRRVNGNILAIEKGTDIEIKTKMRIEIGTAIEIEIDIENTTETASRVVQKVVHGENMHPTDKATETTTTETTAMGIAETSIEIEENPTSRADTEHIAMKTDTATGRSAGTRTAGSALRVSQDRDVRVHDTAVNRMIGPEAVPEVLPEVEVSARRPRVPCHLLNTALYHQL